jgi:hypothetical protein
MSLDFQVGKEKAYLIGFPTAYAGGYATSSYIKFGVVESTRSYLSENHVWYTPCSLKYPKWSHFFHIFSVRLWITFALTLVLSLVTVSCVSNYRYKLNLHESSF